jgi:hypothetical protein
VRHQAELASREVEASWVATYQRSHASRLLRALDCYTQAYMFVRADGPRWAVQHINEAAIKLTGARRGGRGGARAWARVLPPAAGWPAVRMSMLAATRCPACA